MRKFVVIVEAAEGNFSAYSPDLPGCVATGATPDETMQNMIQAIRFHLEGCEGKPLIESKAIYSQLLYV